MNKIRLQYFPAVFFICSLFLNSAYARKPAVTEKKVQSRTVASKSAADRLEIDSLYQLIVVQNGKIDSLEMLLKKERLSSADLREQIIKLDDYRKQLEGNVDSFKGENLKLNQSNRILIVFNSLVAVLLIISLVFFLRKIGRKKNEQVAVNPPVNGKQNGHVKFTNFEDKLAQLERLGKLREKELLSEEEFVVEKQKILGT